MHVSKCELPYWRSDVVQNSLLSFVWLDHAEVVHVLECEQP